MQAYWATASNLVLNAVVSVLCSWVVAWYYFRKETPAEKIGGQIRYGLQKALLPIIYPDFFQETSVVVTPRQAPPTDTDIPHVELVRYRDGLIAPGRTVEMLIKMIDTGYDLENPSGVSILDHERSPVGIVPVGLGYCKASLYIRDQTPPGDYEITIMLRDEGERKNRKSNTNVQTVSLPVRKEC